MLEHLQNFSGCLNGECLWTCIAAFVLGFVILGYNGAPFFLWALLGLAAVVGFGAPTWLVAAVLVIGVIGTVKPLRTALVSKGIMVLLAKLKFLPAISETERTAIEAGSTWMEAELFSGRPNFAKMMSQPYPKLTAEEQAFMDNQVNKLCQMIDDWEIWKTRRLPDAVWTFIRREKFLGMIIPKEYGGLGFSAYAHSEVIRKVASRSLAVTIYIMVPNSLGPAELLNHYGTDEQKKTMLPRLANGEDIPCFALTEPTAGSDAGSITAEGVLFKGADGKIMMRLNWNKRWITLAAISTLVGLAFRLRDPEKLLGGEVDLGITCAIIPASTKGVILGERHDPLGVPFHNCPTQGKDVEISVDAIIGGVKNAGKGWKMLMECLAAGRGISFPAQSVGNAQLLGRAVSAHALVRQQFGLSIGRFEGVQDSLAKVAGYSYILDALRLYTLSALDQGTKPAVVTAISKYHSTELARQISIHGMDIMGGAGISLGPRNLIGHSHIAAPVAITVEGANILTRTLMIFGQGALRAHPYAYSEVKALEAGDATAFDRAFWGHIGHVVRNAHRSVVLSITHGWLTPYAFGKGSTAIYYRRIAWVSASFAIMADIAMGSLGGMLKIKESITGRFADILSYMYICVAILKRYEEDGAKKEDLPIVHFAMAHLGAESQRAFDGIFENLPVPGLSWFFRTVIRSWSGLHLIGGDVSDSHVHKIANLVLDDVRIRELLTGGAFKPTKDGEQMKRLDDAVDLFRKVEGIEKKLRRARKEKKISKKPRMQMIADALAAGVITAEEKSQLEKWEVVRIDAIQVDSFTEAEYHRS
ncbi:MAG: acyl-CoA dehydrogenase [Bdellovibrionales bacterium]|nr:acyl-CoA dehydrogenase [Bdellovibrionales bacterium]